MKVGENLQAVPYKLTHSCVNMLTGEVLYEDVFVELLYEPSLGMASKSAPADLEAQS